MACFAEVQTLITRQIKKEAGAPKCHTWRKHTQGHGGARHWPWIIAVDKEKEGKNKGEGIDSYSRYIYIHGTSEEGKLGTPASHGCIRMKNKDVIDLYNKVEVGTLVLIL